MALGEKLYTVAEFVEIAQLEENAHKNLELHEGIIIEMPPSNKRNTTLAMLIGHYLLSHVLERDLGHVSGADGGYQIDDHTMLIPDTAFIVREKITNLDGVIFEAAPDIAVEVISPSESPAQVFKKTRTYLEGGTQIVWSVYPDEQEIHVHTRNADASINTVILDKDDTLSGGNTLPDFELLLSKVFR